MSTKTRLEHGRTANLGVRKVIVHDAQSARRELGDRCMSEAELLEKERVVTE